MIAATARRSMLGLVACATLISKAAQVDAGAAANERRQVQFAERVILSELSRDLSATARREREKCPTAFPESGALTLGIGSIGCGRTDAATIALLNLTGLRLDGEGAEELMCQILVRGKPLITRLQTLDPGQVSAHCRGIFDELRKRELSEIPDVTATDVCRAPVDILQIRDEFVKALRAGKPCPN